jgi:hypothetical protein
MHPRNNLELQPFSPHLDPLEWHHLPIKFHENLPIGSKVTEEKRQTGDLISLLSFLECRLIKYKNKKIYY